MNVMREQSVQCISPAGLHRMAYTEWGEPDNPKVLVCVHGLTRSGRDFDFLAERLAGEYRVVCPDVVGRGRSDWLKNKALYGVPQYAADMVTLLARLNVDSVHWLGTSMGGLIGMALAAQENTPIARLVLNDVGRRSPRCRCGASAIISARRRASTASSRPRLSCASSASPSANSATSSGAI